MQSRTHKGSDINYNLIAFLITLILFKKQILSFIKPDSYIEQIEKPASVQAERLVKTGSTNSTGNFIVIHNGVKIQTRYTVRQAQSDAETLSGLLNTDLKSSWYNRLLHLTIGSTASQIKKVLNPNYPSAYRRTVIEFYRDVATNKRSLLNDTRDYYTSLISSEWTNDLTKYFKL